MVRPEISFVVARADNGVIGRDNALPWRLPADLARFRRLTAGAPMIMGRRTFDSLPGVLPGRRHLVLTRDPAWRAAGAEVAHGIADALALVGGPRVSVIGGAEVFRLFEPLADRVELTEVHAEPEGDVAMPPFDPFAWDEVQRSFRPIEGPTPAYSFVTLERRLS